MSFHASTWIPVAVGIVLGASLGFREGRATTATQASTSAPAVAPEHRRARAAAEDVQTPEPLQPAAVPERVAVAAAPQLLVEDPLPQTPPPRAPAVRAAAAKKAAPVQTASAHVAQPRAEQTPAGGELNDARAIFRAESACARKDPEQCLRASRAFRDGSAIRPNLKSASIYWHSALRIYEERCKRREAMACVGLAAMFEKGPGTQPAYAPDLLEHARGICRHRPQARCDEIDDEAERLRLLVVSPSAP